MVSSSEFLVARDARDLCRPQTASRASVVLRGVQTLHHARTVTIRRMMDHAKVDLESVTRSREERAEIEVHAD